MCGLVGVVSCRNSGISSNSVKFLQQGLVVDTLRGEDGTGIGGILRNNTVRVFKGAVPGPWFVASSYVEDMLKFQYNYKVLMGHNRKATVHGGSPDDMAHPFHVQDLVFTHNGTLKTQVGLEKVGASDSQNLAATVAKAQGDNEIVDILSKVDGAYALAWYDALTQIFYLARNEERPLWYAYGSPHPNYEGGKPVGPGDSTHMYYASEAGMLQWVAERNNIHITRIEEVPTFKLLSWDMAKEAKKMSETHRPRLTFQAKPNKPYQKNGHQPRHNNHVAKKIPLEVGSTCLFTIGHFECLASKDGDRGVGMGETEERNKMPDTRVMVYGVDLDLLLETPASTLFSGEVERITSNNWKQPIIWVKPESMTIESEVYNSKGGEEDYRCVFDGPFGPKTLTPHHYRIAVRDGCVVCGETINQGQHKTLEWDPVLGPYHKECKGKLQSMDTVRNVINMKERRK